MPGQIERGRGLGDMLYLLASDDEVRECVEVGTLDGEGSTYCIAQGLAQSGGRLTSVELKGEHYRRARRFYEGKGLPVEIVHGLTLTVNDYPPFEHYLPKVARTVTEAREPGLYREWYLDELEAAGRAPRQGVLHDLAARGTGFDLVMLDGGEFLSDAEFRFLEPHISGYVVVDDTNPERCIKNAWTREHVLGSPEWEVLADETGERNGWLAARRIRG